MKKIFITVGVLAGLLANAQIKVQSNISNSIVEQNPFLDASNYSKGFGNSEGKGLYFPQTDLRTWEFKTNGINPGNFSTYFDGMIVYNTGEGAPTTDANVGGIRQNLERGFYYFKNPNQTFPGGSIANGEWVKLGSGNNSNSPWIYNTEGNVELNYATSKIEEKYTVDQHIEKSKGFDTYQIYPWENITSDTPIAGNPLYGNVLKLEAYNANNILKKEADDTKANFTAKLGVVDNTVSSNYDQIYLNSDGLTVDATNTKDYDRIYTNYFSANHMGSGTIERVMGGAAVAATYPKSTVVNQYGYFGQSSQYSNQNSSNVVGLAGYASQRGDGEIANLIGVQSLTDNKTDLATGNIGKMIGFDSSQRLRSDFTGSVTDMIGLLIRQNIYESVNDRIENNYGIHINSITSGINKYAIYTNLGDIRFGQLADNSVTESRLVAVDSDGKLVIGNASSAYASKWVNNAGNQAISIGNLSDGTTQRPENQNLYVKDNGDVGIGVIDPKVKLAVENKYSGLDYIQDEGLFLVNSGTSTLSAGIHSAGAVEISSDHNVNYSSSTGRFEGIAFKISGQEHMRVAENGKVGIGTITPTEKLEIAGAVKAESFKGSNGATIFPDYVFENYYTGNSTAKADYKFVNLSQVEDFVKTNGHLPGYVSAKEIKAQGYIDIMDTQLTNVEKIEELYLHTIEQEKAIKTQKEELKAKDAKIAELETRLSKIEKLLNK